MQREDWQCVPIPKEELKVENRKFWMVWAPNGGVPSRKHETYESAKDEAKRLASDHPGRDFFVLAAKDLIKGQVSTKEEHLVAVHKPMNACGGL